jgi:IS605 OrfB family transposase
VHQALSGYASLFSRASRTLHARLEAQAKLTGKAGSTAPFKNEALVEFGLTGRQFNALQVSLDGRRKSVEECRALNIETIRDRLDRLDKTIAELKASLEDGRFDKRKTSRKPLTTKQRRHVLLSIHLKSRKLAQQKQRLGTLESERDRGTISMCFGSRKHFGAQHHLQANGYADHTAWRKDWAARRNDQFLVLGSKDETSGCQGCVATIAEDDTLTLRVRLPQALVAEHGAYAEVKGVCFAYGHDLVLAALRLNEARRASERESQAKVRAEAKLAKDAGEPEPKYSAKNVKGGVALSWRFMHDAKGWEVLVSVAAPQQALVSVASSGRVAVDINADHLAVAETDYFGNYVKAFSVPCRTQGLTSEQAAAAIGDAVKAVMAHVIAVRKPLVLERLDFKAKKRALNGENPAYARMLSSFAYTRIRTLFEARAFDAGIEVGFVNPAFTSVIGRVKYSVPLGITTHEAAAVTIARRSQGARERAPRPQSVMRIPVKGGVTAWTAPVWTLPQHRTRPWRYIARQLPRLCEREPARNSPAASVSGTRKRTLAGAGEAEQPPVQA